ncbi:protein NEDD1 isoform X2 [Aristolochia californica]|uniref:protein NEDD1 isoform X2 n=1 Tax=Aristolochia californica TaxID=171875 RepID=UPI0035D58A75
MNLMDLSTTFLAACGGDTVKVFDISKQPNDPCTLTYSPSPGSQVNSVKWNHTNFVVASAGDDKKISLWRKNGQSMGTLPASESEAGDNIDESILAISFSNKGSRYLCSGGSGQVVRIWDLQRKRCIKWLRGHTETITGVMYNCKDEHLASISLKGDLILHNLASGVRAAELKDPDEQVLRVLDYSRISRHVLVTAGDDGSVHLWDTTGRNPKISWAKQHSAPTTGVCFSPSNDKVIASVGLDKKLVIFDSGTRRPTSSVSYEAPFSSIAIRDDGWTLAAGTNTGRVVFYDVRGKPQPTTVLRAFSSSEAVTSLCWQRSKPIIITQSNCTPETVLLGGSGEDSVLMPDQLPSTTSTSLSSATVGTGSRGSGRLVSLSDTSILTTTNSGVLSSTSHLSTEETPQRNHLWTGAALGRLQATRTGFNFSDDMDVFSPLVEVQPIAPSLGHWWDDKEEVKKDSGAVDKKSTVLPSSSRRFAFSEDGNTDHSISDWKSYSITRQEDSQSTSSPLSSTPVTSLKSDQSFSPTPPEAWGANPPDKFGQIRSQSKPSRFMPASSQTSFSLASGSLFSGLQESSLSTSQTTISSLLNTSLNSTNLQSRDIFNYEIASGLSESSSAFSSISTTSLGSKNSTGSANLDLPGSQHLSLPRRFSTYTERISTASSFSEVGLGKASPKLKKTGAETREELMNSALSRFDTSTAIGTGATQTVNGSTLQPQRNVVQTDLQQGTSFTLQLVQRTLEESLTSVQKSVHEDMRNLHIELLRQFHIQETEMSTILNGVLEKLAELTKEVQSLRKENQQLRQLL